MAYSSCLKFYLPIPVRIGGKWSSWRQMAISQITKNPQTVSIKVSGLLAEWGHGLWRSFLKALWKYPPFSHLRTSLCVCVCSCVCKWLSSGFIRLQWCLDSRKSSTNRTEWCRNGQKAPLEFLKLIFSLPYFYPLTLFQSLTHFSPLSALLLISIALLSQPWLSHSPGVAPLIFHIPLFLQFGLFPKALWISGEAFSHWLPVHGNFSLLWWTTCGSRHTATWDTGSFQPWSISQSAKAPSWNH